MRQFQFLGGSFARVMARWCMEKLAAPVRSAASMLPTVVFRLALDHIKAAMVHMKATKVVASVGAVVLVAVGVSGAVGVVAEAVALARPRAIPLRTRRIKMKRYVVSGSDLC